MPINLFSRSPLGVFFRSTLGVRGRKIYQLRRCDASATVKYTDDDLSAHVGKVIEESSICWAVSEVGKSDQTTAAVTVDASHTHCIDCVSGPGTGTDCTHCDAGKTPDELTVTFTGASLCPCAFGLEPTYNINGTYVLPQSGDLCVFSLISASQQLGLEWTASDCTGSSSAYNRALVVTATLSAGPIIEVKAVSDPGGDEFFWGRVALPECDFPVTISDNFGSGICQNLLGLAFNTGATATVNIS